MLTLKIITLSSLLILQGCTSLAPPYQRPALPVPQQFSVGQNALVAARGINDSGWRNFFTDPLLKSYIGEALQHNPDLRMATLKVAEARSQYKITDADRYPQLNGATDGTYSGPLKGNAATSRQYSAGLDISYDLDFFGRLKNLSEADRQSYFASQQAQRAVHILLVANVTQSYYSQRLAFQQLQVARETLINYQQSYSFVEKQLLTGSTTLLALEQAKGVIATTQAEVAKREGELAQANHALWLVLGRSSALAENNSQSIDHLDEVQLPPRLSSTILLQRPDIAEAEHLMMAADANIGAARAAFFPSISLTGDITGSSTNLSSLFNAASGMWNFIPKIDVPLFNAGRNKANLSLAEVRQQQTIVTYEKRIQTAFKEVADQLSLKDSYRNQLLAQEAYLASLQISLQRATALYAHGVVSYIDVLDAERNLFATRQAILDLKYARQINEVNLFTALGGGWVE